MSERKEPVPASDSGFDRRFKLITQVTALKTGGANPEWTHIPQAKVQQLITAYADWYTAYGPTLVPHSEVETREKDRLRGLTEPVLRRFIQRYLYVEEVTAAELESMELPLHDTTRTIHGRPHEHVNLIIKPNAQGELWIDFTCAETGKRGRPDLTYKGMVLYVQKLGPGGIAPPVASFEHSKLLTRSPHIEEFPLDESGTKVAFSGCWENGHGEEGPRCPAVVVVIP
jgi:hypothetical protein